MIDRSDYLSEGLMVGTSVDGPATAVQCDCQRFRLALGPDSGSYDTKRNGERVLKPGRRSGSEEFCKCRHYPTQHALNGRCEAMLWDQSAHEPWNVDNQGRPVPVRVAE